MFFVEAIALGFFMYCVYIVFFEKNEEEPLDKNSEHASINQHDASRKSPL